MIMWARELDEFTQCTRTCRPFCSRSLVLVLSLNTRPKGVRPWGACGHVFLFTQPPARSRSHVPQAPPVQRHNRTMYTIHIAFCMLMTSRTSRTASQSKGIIELHNVHGHVHCMCRLFYECPRPSRSRVPQAPPVQRPPESRRSSRQLRVRSQAKWTPGWAAGTGAAGKPQRSRCTAMSECRR